MKVRIVRKAESVVVKELNASLVEVIECASIWNPVGVLSFVSDGGSTPFKTISESELAEWEIVER